MSHGNHFRIVDIIAICFLSLREHRMTPCRPAHRCMPSQKVQMKWAHPRRRRCGNQACRAGDGQRQNPGLGRSGIGTCPRPGGPGTHRAAPNSVRRMLTRRDFKEQDGRRLKIPFRLLTSPYSLLKSCSPLPLHFPPIGCQLCRYSTSARHIANFRQLKSAAMAIETCIFVATAVRGKLRPQTPGPPHARAFGLPLRAPKRWRGEGSDFGSVFASLVAKTYVLLGLLLGLPP